MLRRWLPMKGNYFVDGMLLVIFAATGAFVGFAFVSREPPVQVLEYRLLSLTPNPLKGETFDYEAVFIRNRWCETKVNRWFVDSALSIVSIPALPYSMRTDGLFYAQSAVNRIKINELAPMLPSGPTEWCFRPEWKCNWTQSEYFPPGPILGSQQCMTFWVNNPERPYEEFRRE